MSMIRALAMAVFIIAVILFFAAKFVGLPLASLQEFAVGRSNGVIIFFAFAVVGITELFKERNMYS